MLDLLDVEIFGGLLLVGYLLGSVPWGLILVRAAGLGDIRAIGSGSTGATNVLRAGNKKIAATALLLDVLKGAAAVWIGVEVNGVIGGALAGLGAVAGHMFPVWLGFKGGKGIATGFGVLLVAMPVIAGVCAAVWLLAAILWRRSSAASLLATALAPVLAILLRVPFPLQIMALAIAVLVYERHRSNIARLIAGTEPKIGK